MMWLLNAVLLFWVSVACVGALAAYRSPKVDGPEVVNAMRAAKAGAWGVLGIAMVGIAVTMGRPPIEGFVLAILTVLAFADAASYTERMGELVRSELLS